MSTPFLSEIRLVSFNFAPKGWALCNGQTLPINQNQALFSLLGTNYGGNGQTTFNLPNLRGRVPIHEGNGHNLAETGGSTSVTLIASQMPAHNHFMSARAETGLQNLAGTTPSGTKVMAEAIVSLQGGGTAQAQLYGTGTVDRTLAANSVTNIGGSQPHSNMMPYLVLNYIIALQGIFPSQN